MGHLVYSRHCRFQCGEANEATKAFLLVSALGKGSSPDLKLLELNRKAVNARDT